MIYRQLGKTDLKVSVLGYGCWAAGNQWDDSSDEASIRAIQTAIDLGINFFDVAPVYGYGHAEQVLGRAIAGRRDKVYIATKCGLTWDDNGRTYRNLTRENILREIDESLRRLNVDYVDLYQVHWPDPNVPIEETFTTLEELKRSGKVRYIGVTNFSISLIEQAQEYTEIVSDQVLYNMIDRNSDDYHGLDLNYRSEQEILPYCAEEQLGFIPYSPLCQGLLTDHFDRDAISQRDVRTANRQLRGEALKRNLAVREELLKVAEDYGRPLSQLALNWLIQKPAVTSIIAGALNEHHVQQNAGALEWSLSESDLDRIGKILG
ncbi:MAG: aldo/keto reductase [Firmicutes bacterium]|jgi:aryl-alcohol dehydrogenase-like predicted oxidoreductase|nr:aldo/keto reductase [Bacillota bacterium]